MDGKVYRVTTCEPGGVHTGSGGSALEGGERIVDLYVIADARIGLASTVRSYSGGYAGGGYTPRRTHAHQLTPYSISLLAS